MIQSDCNGLTSTEDDGCLFLFTPKVVARDDPCNALSVSGGDGLTCTELFVRQINYLDCNGDEVVPTTLNKFDITNLLNEIDNTLITTSTPNIVFSGDLSASFLVSNNDNIKQQIVQELNNASSDVRTCFESNTIAVDNLSLIHI